MDNNKLDKKDDDKEYINIEPRRRIKIKKCKIKSIKRVVKLNE